jgi:hypothetical protein
MATSAAPEVNLETLILMGGSHGSRATGVCLLEAVAWMAREPHSDSPECACPVLAAFGRRLNDALSKKDRQLLKPLIPLLINTRRARDVELKRAFFFADRAMRLFAPIELRARGYEDWAKKLEELPAIVDESTARSASKIADAASADAAADAAAAASAAASASASAASAYASASASASAASAAYAASARRRAPSSAEVVNKAIEVFKEAIAIVA